MARATATEHRWRRSAESDRGRDAESPREIPAPGWRDIVLRVREAIANDRLSIISAGVAFYAVLALFPALAALISLYGLLLDPQTIGEQLSTFGTILPREVLQLMGGQLREISAHRSSLSAAVAGAMILALWSASSGIKTLMEALNVAYKQKEQRGFFKLNSVALVLTLGSIVGVIVALAIVVALPAMVSLLPFGEAMQSLVLAARWPILAVAMMVELSVLYRYGPCRRHPRWSWVSWGAALATLLWLVASGLFSFYVAHFGDYNKTYGSVAAVIILLTWLLITAYVILIGAELNAELERQTRKDTTEGPPKPMGTRGASAADTVGRTP